MGLIKASIVERRQSERRRVCWGSWVAPLEGDQVIKCQVNDISAAGARIQVDGPLPIPPAIYFLDMRNRLAYEAQVVWRKAPELGLQFRKVYRFSEIPSAPLAKAIDQL